MAELVLKKGEVVVATARKPEALDDLKAKYPARQLVTVKLNVDNAQEIKDAFSRAKAAFGRIDVVFNNAGWSVMGGTEVVPPRMSLVNSSTPTSGAPPTLAEKR